MIRSMYSGVAGLRTHQTRMDTIGNNIANVNTYGFKAGRTTFRDIYYQNLNSAMGPGTGRGGVNPSQVGTGTQVGSVDLLMGNSTLTMTSQGMDVAVDGDGFLQVMDASGNTYYTRAGMLGFDAVGNLVDMQGNYVLGLNGDPVGRAPASERITVNLPAVPPTNASTDVTINSKDFHIQASNYTKDGNIAMSFDSDPTMNDDIEAMAKITSAGIQITFNENKTFGDWGEVNTAINNAITAAYGSQHPAGEFSVEYTGDASKDPFITYDASGNAVPIRLSGQDLVSINYAVKLGEAEFTAKDASTLAAGVYPNGTVGSKFGETFVDGKGEMEGMAVTYDNTNPPASYKYTITMSTGDATANPPTNKIVKYSGIVDADKNSLSGTFNLKNDAQDADPNDYIVMKRPSFDKIDEEYNGAPKNYTAAQLSGTAANKVSVTSSKPSSAVGLSGSAIALQNGTEGGPQTINDMANISILQDGTVVGRDSIGDEIIIGRIILATFANAAGLEMVGSSKYMESANSGQVKLTEPGLNNSGNLVSGALELSNVDLSNEFSDMITTQRGYQANSRIITVSDTMLEELINLKR